MLIRDTGFIYVFSFISLLLITVQGKSEDFFSQYGLECAASTDTPGFRFMDQPWLTPDSQTSEDEYLEKITQTETDQGVYSAELIPHLTGLGFIYAQAGRHAAAAESYQRALDILKINEGLYSTNQIPLLDILIEENSKNDHWERVSNHYRYMHWLYNRNFNPADPRLLPALKRIRQWEIDSYNKPTNKSLDDHFRVARQIHDQIMRILHTCTDNDRLAHCYLHKGCCPEAQEGAYCPIRK